MDTLIAITHFLPWGRIWRIQEAFISAFRETEVHFFDDEFWILDTTKEEHESLVRWFQENVPEYQKGVRLCLDL